MKIHPLVGAEILEEVKFPYPVVPIVRAHHEKWDGSGYPFGLAGEEIPIGARILAAVDCLDALASDRQYRRALPLDQAMEIVSGESGKSFDPVIVDICAPLRGTGADGRQRPTREKSSCRWTSKSSAAWRRPPDLPNPPMIERSRLCQAGRRSTRCPPSRRPRRKRRCSTS
jgi:HD-GYP domain-containing protein (c-di-GMP phosphodiesterase class II)